MAKQHEMFDYFCEECQSKVEWLENPEGWYCPVCKKQVKRIAAKIAKVGD